MESLYFVWADVTPGHSLNLVYAQPNLAKKLGEHCRKHKCHPVSIQEAVYSFIMENGRGRTYHRVQIDCAAGIGSIKVPTWLKNNPLLWLFGAISDDAREV